VGSRESRVIAQLTDGSRVKKCDPLSSLMQQHAMGLLLGAHGQEILIDRAAAST